MVGFREMLMLRQKQAKTLVCVGLDPLVEKIPKRFWGAKGPKDSDVRAWMKWVIDETAPFASMFKPQSAHWESIIGGVEMLGHLVDYIHRVHPDIPVFLDCKRGDIARTQKQYGIAHFDVQGVDGMNFCPYMGRDTMAALVEEPWRGKALVGLCYTSNPDGRQTQDSLFADIRPSWEHYAKWILQWAEELGVVKNAGLVMAAAYEHPKGWGTVYSRHLTRCRKLVGDKLWFLIPGIGTQGGFVEETVRSAYMGPGTIAINSSSGIIFADDPAGAAKELRDAINSALDNLISSEVLRLKKIH